jgi:hypothetical protein
MDLPTQFVEGHTRDPIREIAHTPQGGLGRKRNGRALMKMLVWIVIILVAAFLAPFIWTMLTAQ